MNSLSIVQDASNTLGIPEDVVQKIIDYLDSKSYVPLRHFLTQVVKCTHEGWDEYSVPTPKGPLKFKINSIGAYMARAIKSGKPDHHGSRSFPEDDLSIEFDKWFVGSYKKGSPLTAEDYTE